MRRLICAIIVLTYKKLGVFATGTYILLKNYKHVFFRSLEKIETDRPEQMVCLKIPELNSNKGHEDFQHNTRVIFYVRRNGLYLYKYRIYGTISIYILERFGFCLSTDINFTSLALSLVKIYSFE